MEGNSARRSARVRATLSLLFALVLLVAPADALAGKDHGGSGKAKSGQDWLSNWTS